MNYSSLVYAVQNNDKKEINRIINRIYPILHSYLIGRFNANTEDAEDCVQDALISSLESIRQNKIRNPDMILSFMLSATRNNFYRLHNRNREIPYASMEYKTSQPSLQFSRLVEEEVEAQLYVCVKKLNKNYREYLLYWFKHADDPASEIAKHFKISLSNAWTRKHRAQKMLEECLQKHFPDGITNWFSVKGHFKEMIHRVTEPKNHTYE